MATVIGQVKSMARYVFQTQSKWVMGVAGPGSAAMEMAVTNLAWQGTRVLCVVQRFLQRADGGDGAARRRATSSMLEDRKRPRAPSADEVAEAIARFRPEIVTIVQGETSNTVWNRNLAAIAALANAKRARWSSSMRSAR